MHHSGRVELTALIRRQHGVLTRAQALGCGLTDDAIRWRVRDGQWTRLAHGIYHAQTGAVTWMARAHALSARLGPGGALTLETAAHLHGIEDRPPQILTGAVVGRQLQRLTGTRIVRRSALETVTRRGLPVTSAATTALDLAATYASGHWRTIVHLLARWVHSGTVDADALLGALERRGRHPHRRLVTTALAPIREGVESILEFDALDGVILQHGLPRPILQAKDDGPQGAIRKDAWWSDYGVVLESDGRLFHTGASMHTDRRRDRFAARSGQLTLRAGHVEIVFGRCELAVDIFLALHSRGYPGDIEPCQPGCAAQTVRRAS